MWQHSATCGGLAQRWAGVDKSPDAFNVSGSRARGVVGGRSTCAPVVGAGNKNRSDVESAISQGGFPMEGLVWSHDSAPFCHPHPHVAHAFAIAHGATFSQAAASAMRSALVSDRSESRFLRRVAGHRSPHSIQHGCRRIMLIGISSSSTCWAGPLRSGTPRRIFLGIPRYSMRRLVLEHARRINMPEIVYALSFPMVPSGKHTPNRNLRVQRFFDSHGIVPFLAVSRSTDKIITCVLCLVHL